MGNIIIVGFDEDLCKSVAQELAKKKKMTFVDVQMMLYERLKNIIEDKLFSESDYQIQENKVVDDALRVKKAVLLFDTELFMANDNFAKFTGLETIYLDDGNIVCDIKNKKKRNECNNKAVVHNSISGFLKTVNAHTINCQNKSQNEILNEILALLEE